MNDDLLVVRKVDKQLYRRFKQKATAESTSVGRAINDAMKDWINKKERKKIDPKGLLALNGIIKVGRPVRWSEEIDKTLYG